MVIRRRRDFTHEASGQKAFFLVEKQVIVPAGDCRRVVAQGNDETAAAPQMGVDLAYVVPAKVADVAPVNAII
jgi:hypothetical protein